MSEKSPKDSKKTPKKVLIWKFILSYVLLMGSALLLISLKPIKEVVDINGLYTTMIVHISAWLMKPFGIVQGINGSIIHLKGLSLDVLFGCNGLEAFLIYSVAILSFPAKIIKKVWGILIGFIVIQVLNVIRIAGLGLSGIYLKRYFEYIHIYVAQGIMIAVAMVLFLFWLNYAAKK